MGAEADKRCIVFLGPPGSGKGTQAEILAAEMEIPTISTGEMLRAAVSAGSELGERVEAVMASGALVDDDLMAEVVQARLEHDDTDGGFFLDGYPRTEIQAAHLDRILGEVGGRLGGVLFVTVPEEELVRRALARGRGDDRSEVIHERLRVYREQTAPLVAHYDSRGLLHRVAGHQAIEEVTDEIRRIVGALAA